MSEQQLILLPLWYVVFLLSVTCHEAAHAFAARRGGDDTAYLGGQVSLNPVPHMQRELGGTVLIPLLSYLYLGWMMGWASAPYDPYWEERHPRRAAWMAAAGPLANLGLAAVGFVALKTGLATGVWEQPLQSRYDLLVVAVGEDAAGWEALGRLCSIMLTLNVVLFLFNLLPIPPMDGASVLAGLSESARRVRERLRANAYSGWIGLLVAWFLFGYLFRPIFRQVVIWLYA